MSTIAAVSTPLAASGLGVVRISGEEAFRVGDAMFRPAEKNRSLAGMWGYTCAFGRVFDAEGDIDEAVATVFRAPRSYTGEDTVEFSCHGSPAVLKRVLRAALANGAALAGPGEFTKRAFLNGKLSLDEAEAVADMIAARSAEAGKAALAMMDGSLYREISGIRDELLALEAHFAAWSDYPEEDVPELSAQNISTVLAHSDAVLKKLIAGYDTGRMVRQGAAVVIAGKPNVGKSTIMNLLSGHSRSIVTEVAGTTRDVVEESVLIGCIPVRLLDTAGLRETADPVERIGVDLANAEIARCDLLIAVFDSSRELDADDLRLLDELATRPS
ncbi:MAG TPA: tRNA uridine-5-carboxymethylaminomethyl(34) synthesis GTPase MnmE, partial [Oscillospiraceae bacterium]|nr:tRNA uridine-5-carboxymethylaminomethyl(34) synthesis GTPase MnmE [Oscillospiraceae bacterium]